MDECHGISIRDETLSVMLEKRVDGTMRITQKGWPFTYLDDRRASVARDASSQDRAPTAPSHVDRCTPVAYRLLPTRDTDGAVAIT